MLDKKTKMYVKNNLPHYKHYYNNNNYYNNKHSKTYSHNSLYSYLIPFGKKWLAWFTLYNNKYSK